MAFRIVRWGKSIVQQAAERQIAMEAVLLATAPADVASTILDQSGARSFDRGETIFLQSEPAHSVYIVLDGRVKLFRLTQNGAEAAIDCRLLSHKCTCLIS